MGRPKRSADKLAVTRQAVTECFPQGPTKGLSAKERLNTINARHRKNGRIVVPLATVRRALLAK
jgi:hypothetical protein